MSYQTVEPTQELLNELEQKHGDILLLRGDKRMAPYLFVFRRPKRQETIGYKVHLKKDSTTANEELIRRIAVYPDKPEIEKIFDIFSFAPDGCVNNSDFQNFVGISTAADLKE